MSFELAFAHTVGIEGGFTDDPNDPGGPTIWGITIADARAHGYTGPMQDMPIGAAKQIYLDSYWNLLHLDRIDPIAPGIAAKLFDIGVNCGVSIPVPFLQTALNAFNRQASDFPDAIADGLLGPVTAGGLASYLKIRGSQGEIVLMAALDAQLGERYLCLAKINPNLEDFEYGWFANRVVS